MPQVQDALFSLDEVYRPQRPLCSNRKDGGYRRRSRDEALGYAYIETNPLCIQSLVVADVDHGDWWDYEAAGVPAPTWRTYTLLDSSYHAVWALRDPVCLTDAARRAPVNLLARVEAGLRRAVHADAGYGGRITKNPLNDRHTTTWGINGEHSADSLDTYTLRELAAALDYADLLPKLGERKALLGSDVGRNVSLFDVTRNWAYRAVKRYWHGAYSEWEETVYAYALNKNLGVIADEWGTPLPDTEVLHLARSISKWVWRRFNPEQFTELQRHRVKQRWGTSTQEFLTALELPEVNYS